MAKRPRREEAGEAVRSAVDRTVQATIGQAQLSRERAQELVDELATTAGRVRDALDDLRGPSTEDLSALQARVDALEARVAELETARRPAGKRAAETKPAAGRRKAGTRASR
jgi:polyhydroxyalkanoate synthesis regulator phasin